MGKVLYQSEEQKTGFLSKRGNIVTFKEPFYPNGMANKGYMQIIVSKLEKDPTGAVRIAGPLYDTPWNKNLATLLNAVDWDWMAEAHKNQPKQRLP